MEIILGACTLAGRQTCLFSATLPAWVVGTAKKYMAAPELVDVVGNSSVQASTDVRHVAIPTHWETRAGAISDTISMFAGAAGRTIVFCETKLECNELSVDDALKFESKALHGDVPQATREATMAAFRKGKFRVLIATDVAARGLDMVVDLVINNKPPESRAGRAETETYVHRSGRTGRAGRKGICVTLFTPKQRGTLQTIEKQTKNAFEWRGAPQPAAILRTAAQTGADDAAAVAPAVSLLFRPAAASLLAKMDGDCLAALSGALAVATGYTELPAVRSLLSSAEGFATVHFDGQGRSLAAMSDVWAALRRVLPPGFCESNTNVRQMQLTADESGAVMDVKVSAVKDDDEPSKDGLSLGQLQAVCDQCGFLTLLKDTLPPLKERFAPAPGGGKGGWGGGKGGGKGGFNGGKGGKGSGKGGKGHGSPFFGGRGGRGRG
jgi:ATP-dependent RNA helicase DDX21